MQRSWSHALRAAAVAAAISPLAACVDRANPVGPTPPDEPGGPGAPPVTVQAVACTGNRQALTVTCAPAAPPGGASADLIVGNQNVYVRVISGAATYNSGTGQFTFPVSIQNLIEQPLGTVDGTTLDPAGVRIFFQQGPTVTGGTGVAAVFPDGFATFTAAGQAFYQYNQILASSQTSSSKVWTLIIPPTVTSFDFLLFVSAAVEYPNGYITLNGQLPEYAYGPLHPGTAQPLAAVVKTAVGNVVPGATVAFATPDPLCATVDAGGTVTGVRASTCTITAASTAPGGPVGGSMTFDVTGTVRTWQGDVSADWSVGGNWAGDLTPAPVDSVLIPTGVPNFPALVAATPIGGVEVADGATLSLGAFNLTASANVHTGATAGSGVLGTTGALVLAGASKTVRGRVPSLRVPGTYTLSGDLFVVAPGTVEAGTLTSPLFELRVVAQ